ncbi:hypothetical protein AQ623_02155 [Flavobacterium columnare]|nr:hypothetical protein AQ623_02155 [Flavobacterium columnare]
MSFKNFHFSQYLQYFKDMKLSNDLNNFLLMYFLIFVSPLLAPPTFKKFSPVLNNRLIKASNSY